MNLNVIGNYINDYKSIYVAYSGGIDSTALLYACFLLKQESKIKKLTAIHINHNLSENAKLWESHCYNICNELDIKLIVKNIKIKTSKDGLESAARKARYDIFSNLIKKDELLLVAHHADDVAETILFRLFRGTGIDGLEGPKKKRSIGRGTLIRPLLQFTKKELLEFIDIHNINYIEDESNKESNQDRNFIRNEIMPLINERWNNFEKRIQSTSDIIKDRQEIFNLLFLEKYGSLVSNNSIPLDIFKGLDSVEAKELIRFIIDKSNIALPSKKVLNEIMKTFHTSNPSESSIVKWSRADKEQRGGKVIYNSDFIAIKNIEYSGMITICKS
jgi:tRNA(Ile)-lysidine synthase